ncbi:hypothetical protein DSO57_1008861 [Entomophthora muscae]|uniref:Uncharacterized protein n=1 Tax=Entomophthora muscae TaxID=34485 RepID=A0ACC2RY22_9FUNG|nr:hypothetical protein DSO57_1008861 [Entomophthora muscae]
MSPLQLEGAPKEKWELQPGKPTQSVHPLCGPGPPGFGGVLPARRPLFLTAWENHPDSGLKVGHGVLQDDPEMYAHLKPTKRARTEDKELPTQLLAPRMANPAKAAGKEKTCKGT